MRGALLSILLCLFLPSLAQEAEVVVQAYHTARVEVIKFSPDGSKIATGGHDKIIKVWETRTSKLICSFSGYSFSVNGLSFSPDGKYLISDGDVRDLKLWNISSGKEEDFFKTKGSFAMEYMHGIAFDATGNYLATTNHKGEIKLFDFATKQQLKTFKGPEGRIDQFGFTTDGKCIYAFGNANGGRVISRETGNAVLQLAKPANVYTVAYDPSGNYYALGYNNGAIEIKNAQHQIIKKLNPGSTQVSELAFSPYGKYLIAAYGMYNYFVFDTKTFEEKFKDARIAFCSVGEMDSAITVAYKGGKVKVIYPKTGKSVETQAGFELHTVADANSALRYFLYLADDNSVKICRVADGHEAKTISGFSGYPVSAYFSDKDKIITRYSNGYGYSFSFTELKQEFIDDGNSVGEEPPMFTRKIDDEYYLFYADGRVILQDKNMRQVQEFDLGKPIKAGDVSPDKKYLVLLTDKSITVHENFAKEPKQKYNTGSMGVYNILVSNDNKSVYAINGLKRLVKYDMGVHRTVYEAPDPTGIVTTASEDAGKHYPLLETGDAAYVFHAGEEWAVLVRNADGSLYKSLRGHAGRITHLSLDSAEERLISTSEDGTTVIWDWKKGEKIITLVSSGENWVIVTPENYYFNNKNGYKLVGFKLADKAVPFEQFDIEYNRPDKVMEKLGAEPEQVNKYYLAYLKRLKKEGIKPKDNAAVSIPVIIVKELNSLPLETAKNSIDLTLKATDEKLNLGKLMVWVNGVPMQGKSGFKVSGKSAEKKVKILLSAGRNVVKISAVNEAGIESTPETFEINYTATAKKPNLYLMCVGVSNYKNQRMNLKYAAKDSRDLLAALKASQHFATVSADTFLNERATRENILSFKKKLAKALPEDVVVISLSGHGLLDDSLNFYFATHDIDFAKPALRGLAYDEIEGILDDIPARNKLLLMDACHSGETDKEGLEEVTETATLNNGKKAGIKSYRYKGNELLDDGGGTAQASSFDLMMELFSNLNKGSGTVVVSAAAGNSFALESDDWKNGIFTYSILEGIKEKSADLNSDGQISISELKTFVSANVEKMTNGRQKPTSRSDNMDMDWVFWKY